MIGSFERDASGARSGGQFSWLRAWSLRGVWALTLALTVIACGPPPAPIPERSRTTAELRVVRRGVQVTHPGEAARAPHPRERLGEAAVVAIEAGGLGWMRRDGGTTLLVRGPATLRVGADRLLLDAGRAFAETPSGRTETLQTPAGALVLSAVRASVEVTGQKTDVYVLEGEVRLGEVAARAGERLVQEGGGKPEVRPALSWEDWTGGLATTDRVGEPPPFGVGTVGARRPSTTEAFEALTIRRLDVRVVIDGDLAHTEIDQEFFNPHSEVVEGQYRFRVPEGAILERFGVDRSGGILFGYVKEKKAAAAQYAANVAAGEDPALLAYRGPGEYEARLFPIGPGQTRRVVVRYTEWLARTGAKAERRHYVYPMASEGSAESAPHIEDYSVEIDVAKAGAKEVRAGMDAVRVGDVLVVRGHDLVPRADLSIELFDDGPAALGAVRSPHRPDLVALGDAEQRDARRSGSGEPEYLIVPIPAAELPARPAGLDLVIVVDASAATDASMLALARASTRALLAHVGPEDRVAVLAGDDRLRPVVAGKASLEAANPALVEEALRGLSQLTGGGASDVGAMLSEAASLLDEKRNGAVVYVGDGAPTVGELTAERVRERLGKAPRPSRIFALGIGETAQMGLLETIATGGTAQRVTDERSAARAALAVLERAERGAELGVKIDLGAGVERVYPRELGAVTEGETTFVVGRISGELPKEVRITTTRGERALPLEVTLRDDHGDLRRRWAVGRLAEMMAAGEGHAALVDLGVRQGIVTPVTSLYVSTTDEMTQAQRASIERRSRKRVSQRALVDARDGDGKDQEEEEKPGLLDGLLRSSKSDEAPSAVAQAESDNKEGGTGTRAKGEEGSMGKSRPERAAATASPAAPAAPPMDAVAVAEPEPRGGADVAGGKRRDDAPASETIDAPKPVAAAPPAQAAPQPMASGTSGEIGLGNIGTIGHGAGPGTGSGFGAGRGRLESKLTESSPDVARQEALKKEANEFGMIGLLDAEDPWGDGERRKNRVHDGNVVVVIGDPGRIFRPCSRAADVPFAERQRLWRERFTQVAGDARAIHAIYRAAQRTCEVPGPRERTTMLRIALDFLPSVDRRVALYRLVARDVAVSAPLYRAILSRITTPDDLRLLHQALGVLTADPAEVEKAIAAAKTPAERLTALRAILARFPDDRTLSLQVLGALEDADDPAGARAFARKLRQRSDADARLRTAVGELHLRLAAKAADPALRAAEEQEAKRAFGEIVEFSPDDPVARRRLGDLLRAHGYHAEATRQYETLAALVPDDPAVPLLLAMSAEGLGKLEEAVRWTEKGGRAGAPDAAQGPHVTARALAATFLAWGRLAARDAGKADEVEALGARLARVLADERRDAGTRVVLSWSHPDLHPTLWTDAAGALLPAPEGDVTLGISQAVLADGREGRIEVRVEPAELAAAERLGAKAILTVVVNEGRDGEVVHRREIAFSTAGGAKQALRLAGGSLESVVAVEVKK